MLANLFGADLAYVLVILVFFGLMIGGIVAVILRLARPRLPHPPYSGQPPQPGVPPGGRDRYWSPPGS